VPIQADGASVEELILRLDALTESVQGLQS